MGSSVFIDVEALERGPLHFDEAFAPGSLRLPQDWKQVGVVATRGSAELLDQKGIGAIRVRGRIGAKLGNECARCLEGFEEGFDSDFELYFYPMEMIAKSEEKRIGRDEMDLGFYEGKGIGLADVIREQLLLWLPMRGLCRRDCKGICPLCGKNRNQTECGCREEFVDPRWEDLRHMDFTN